VGTEWWAAAKRTTHWCSWTAESPATDIAFRQCPAFWRSIRTLRTTVGSKVTTADIGVARMSVPGRYFGTLRRPCSCSGQGSILPVRTDSPVHSSLRSLRSLSHCSEPLWLAQGIQYRSVAAAEEDEEDDATNTISPNLWVKHFHFSERLMPTQWL